jgi:hypothetical protein
MTDPLLIEVAEQWIERKQRDDYGLLPLLQKARLIQAFMDGWSCRASMERAVTNLTPLCGDEETEIAKEYKEK